MKRLLLLTMFLLCLPLAMPARAALNYQDMWWLPSESGWGLMVLHQGNTISAVMFHYRADRKPAWYLLSNAQRGTEESFSGTLFEVTGPPLFGLFDPATVLPRNVGSMSLRFTGPNEARLSYTIDGASTQRVIERITFANLDVDGVYFVLPVELPEGGRASDAWEFLRERGVETRRWYCPPLPENPAFASMPVAGDIAVAHAVGERLLALPFHLLLAPADMDAVVEAVGAYIRTIG